MTTPGRSSTPRKDNNGEIPGWVTVTVILALLALLAYNVVIVGPEGYPTSMLLGGLLGAYAGVDQLLKRRRDNDRDGDGDDGP